MKFVLPVEVNNIFIIYKFTINVKIKITLIIKEIVIIQTDTTTSLSTSVELEIHGYDHLIWIDRSVGKALFETLMLVEETVGFGTDMNVSFKIPALLETDLYVQYDEEDGFIAFPSGAYNIPDIEETLQGIYDGYKTQRMFEEMKMANIKFTFLTKLDEKAKELAGMLGSLDEKVEGVDGKHTLAIDVLDKTERIHVKTLRDLLKLLIMYNKIDKNP